MIALDDAELRILGCLVEKQHTTPDSYPLTLNTLRLACNQATNREPVLDLDEATIRDAVHRLCRRGLARFTSGSGSRVAKYRHRLDEDPGLVDSEMSVLAVLLLRGTQTPGELKARVERLHAFESLSQLDITLAALIDRGLVARVDRRPGQKEDRYVHLLAAERDVAATPAAAPMEGAHVAHHPMADHPAPPRGDVEELPVQVAVPREGLAAPHNEVGALREEVGALRGEVASLRGEVASLRGEVASLRGELGALRSEVEVLGEELTAPNDRP